MNDPIPSLTVVLPCHNEEAAIPRLIPALLREIEGMTRDTVCRSAQVIAIDDGSTDATVEMLARHPGVETVSLPKRSGYGGALRAGFNRAEGDLVAFLDLDDTYDPVDLRKLVLAQREGRLDLVTGNRMPLQTGMPAVRWVGNRIYSFLASVLYREPVADACSGFRVFRRGILPGILSLRDSSLSFALSMTLWAIESGLSRSEIPIRYHERKGQSKLRVLTDGIRFLAVILGRYARTQFSRAVPRPRNAG